MITGQHRGHSIAYDAKGERWIYWDTKEPVHESPKRDCARCGKPSTPEGHDPCLRTLPGVMNACCGHGDRRQAYIQFENGVVVRGFDEIEAAE